jgi:hypothetical protein
MMVFASALGIETRLLHVGGAWSIDLSINCNVCPLFIFFGTFKISK